MSREKLADAYMLSVKEMITVLYRSALSEHYSKDQITLVVEEILKVGFREVYLESVDLLLTEEDITAIHLFQTKYEKKTNALKVLIASKAQEIEDKIDFEAILEKLDFKG
jgi:hypothetical protein